MPDKMGNTASHTTPNSISLKYKKYKSQDREFDISLIIYSVYMSFSSIPGINFPKSKTQNVKYRHARYTLLNCYVFVIACNSLYISIYK